MLVSRSQHRNTLRGLHYQLSEPQGKLLRVVEGCVFDVVADPRRSSPDYLKWVGFELAAEDNHLLWIPPRFTRGFLVTRRHRSASSSAPGQSGCNRCLRR